MTWRRVTITLDKEVTKKLLKLQVKRRHKTKQYCSFSKMLNIVLKKGLKKGLKKK